MRRHVSKSGIKSSDQALDFFTYHCRYRHNLNRSNNIDSRIFTPSLQQLDFVYRYSRARFACRSYTNLEACTLSFTDAKQCSTCRNRPYLQHYCCFPQVNSLLPASRRHSGVQPQASLPSAPKLSAACPGASLRALGRAATWRRSGVWTLFPGGTMASNLLDDLLTLEGRDLLWEHVCMGRPLE